jgi:hypothetical protein
MVLMAVTVQEAGTVVAYGGCIFGPEQTKGQGVAMVVWAGLMKMAPVHCRVM